VSFVVSALGGNSPGADALFGELQNSELIVAYAHYKAPSFISMLPGQGYRALAIDEPGKVSRHYRV
jgi:hypothetical protein